MTVYNELNFWLTWDLFYTILDWISNWIPREIIFFLHFHCILRSHRLLETLVKSKCKKIRTVV